MKETKISEAKSKVFEALAVCRMVVVRTDTERKIFFFAPELEQAFMKQHIDPLLRAGFTAKFDDGTSRRIEERVVFDPSLDMDGSRPVDAYIWDKSGNKIAYDRWLFVKDGNGVEISRTQLRRVYKGF